jgi:hypothetical protein
MVKTDPSVGGDPTQHSEVMSLFGARHLAVMLCAVFLAGAATSAQAQGSNPDQKPAEQKTQPSGDAAKAEAGKKRSDELAEARRLLTGPAGNYECTWLGKRVVRLLSNDDLDTAFRHLDLYDRFGCPGNHIQATFRCLLTVGIPDAKTQAPDGLDARVHACWVDPNVSSPQQASSPPTAPAASAAPAPPSGTTTR